MKAYLHHDGDHFDILWNVACSVGKGGQNHLRTDVLFIQWYYKLATDQAQTPPDRRQIYRAVQLTGTCTGRDGDPLVTAIITHQRAINHPEVDGRVSVATGSGKIGSQAFFVLRLGARIANMYPELWPRLDKMPSCPPEVAQAVRKHRSARLITVAALFVASASNCCRSCCGTAGSLQAGIWTRAHRRWLAGQSFDHPAQQIVFQAFAVSNPHITSLCSHDKGRTTDLKPGS